MAFIEPQTESVTRIKVVGVGGGGQNAVGSMIEEGKIDSVEFMVMNTDLQVLNASKSQVRVQLGPDKTRGLGSGSDPIVGLESAEESIEDIRSHLQGADMVFIACGMGGGTGTGASPIVASIAREMGALTVGVVTKPFVFEGKRRMNQAEQGILDLKDKVDALIVIPNEKILDVVEENVPLTEAFKIADRVIGDAVEGISNLISSTGLVNVDFADVKSVMQDAGSALMGIGEASGEGRAEKAANLAIKSPLLDVDIAGSTGILINIEGDASLTMHEVNTASKIISEAAHEGANIIFGASINQGVDGVKVTVIATGFESEFRSLRFQGAEESDRDVIKRIDSRFDSKKEEDDDVVVEPKEHKLDEDFDTSNFDIEVLRKQIQEDEVEDMSDDSTDSRSDDDDDSHDTNESKKKKRNGSFWKSMSQFMKERR